MGLGPLRRRLLLQYLLTVGLLLGGAAGLLYRLMGWAGERELDATLRNELTRLAAAVEVDAKQARLDGKRALERIQQGRHPVAWQVLLDDGTTLLRSRSPAGKAEDLPAVGGAGLPLDEVAVADAREGEGAVVRAARLRTLRQAEAKPKPKPKPPPKAKKQFPPADAAPRQAVFDIRVAVSREVLDQQMTQLGWYLIGGFPIAMGLAAVGGVWLIRRAVRPVERAFDRERRFTGAVSHELRTPLTALRGEIEVALRRERTAAEYEDALRRMQPVVCGMTEMVEGLLVLSRAQAGHLLLGAGEVRLPAIREAVEEVSRLLAGGDRVAICCTASEDLRVVGDGLLLALAARNLIENALAHGEGSPVRVEIQGNASAGLRLTVDDGGPGIPADVLARFQAARADSGGTLRPDGGIGFGLSIARAVVEAHGGTLALSGREGGGCRAEACLPGRPGR
jgi:signal transduction histidine kinase